MMISDERIQEVYEAANNCGHLCYRSRDVSAIIDRLRVAERALDLITSEYKAEVIGLEVDYWKQRAESELRAEGVIA